VAHRPGPHALHQPTKDYVARRITEGKTKTEILRCLKR
jgi:transposase